MCVHFIAARPETQKPGHTAPPPPPERSTVEKARTARKFPKKKQLTKIGSRPNFALTSPQLRPNFGGDQTKQQIRNDELEWAVRSKSHAEGSGYGLPNPHMKPLPRRGQNYVEDFQDHSPPHRAGLTCSNRHGSSRFLDPFQQHATRSGYQTRQQGLLFWYYCHRSVVSRCLTDRASEGAPVGRKLAQQHTRSHSVKRNYPSNGNFYDRTKESRSRWSDLRPSRNPVWLFVFIDGQNT